MSEVTDYKPREVHGRTKNTNSVSDLTKRGVGRESHQSPTVGEQAQAEQIVDRSPYLVQRLLHSNDENLFNHVKFHLVKQCIDALNLESPRILDVGCGLQVSKMYLRKIGLSFDYFGVDYEARFLPGAVVDLLNPEQITDALPWEPDVLLMLDVLEHLHEDGDALQDVVNRIAKTVPDNCTFIFTLPQMYRLDRFKLDHLHYPEHKVRFQQREWQRILESSLRIEKTQGLGYLSVIPYLPMASKRYTPDNRLGRLFHYLRGTVFEWGPFKPADVALSNTLGKLGFCKTVSNDILFVARKKTSSANAWTCDV